MSRTFQFKNKLTGLFESKTYNIEDVKDSYSFSDLNTVPYGMTLNDYLSLDLSRTSAFWEESGFKRSYNTDIKLGAFVKYITTSGMARIGGVVIAINPEWFVLMNMNTKRSWSVQYKNCQDIFIGSSEAFEQIKKNRSEATRISRDENKKIINKEKKDLRNIKKKKKLEEIYEWLHDNYPNKKTSCRIIYDDVLSQGNPLKMSQNQIIKYKQGLFQSFYLDKLHLL